MIEQIKKIRIDIDAMINSTPYLRSSREVSLAHTNLQRGKMWLGKVLQTIGTPNPYPESSNPTNASIEPQAEHTAALLNFNLVESTHTARVKFFRRELDKTITELSNGSFDPTNSHIYFQQAKLALEEAKMWFGWELDRIRIFKDNQNKPLGTSPSQELPL